MEMNMKDKKMTESICDVSSLSCLIMKVPGVCSSMDLKYKNIRETCYIEKLDLSNPMPL